MKNSAAFVAVLVTTVTAHLSLTFPPARFPPLDFLDTVHTFSPCGVPKSSRAQYTSIELGKPYNITWTSASRSKGGHRIRLIDADGMTVEQVSPLNGLDFSEPQTSNWETARFTVSCENCAVVIEQRDSEDVLFHSCSDVNIVSSVPDEEKCSNRGALIDGNCQCETGYTGNICQYYVQCDRDEDCMNDGKCIQQPGSLVGKVCACSYSFFGHKCDQSFNEANSDCFAYESLNTAKYSNAGLFNADCYHKHPINLDDVIYSRLVDKDVEVGWRPEKLHNSCRLFPHLEDTRPDTAEVDEETRLHQVPKQAMPKNNGFLETALNAELHPMDCLDVIMASVTDGRLRIGDFYSRDRSTPLEDYWYDGEMSVVAAYGVEVDGRTIVMFRRQIREFEPTDHPLGPNSLFVAWAKGTDTFQNDFFQYHGANRGSAVMSLSKPTKTPLKPKKKEEKNSTNSATGEVAFGVKNIAHERIQKIELHKTSTNTPTTEPKTEPITTTAEPKTTTSDPSISSDLSRTFSTLFSLIESGRKNLPYRENPSG
ncbi:unnamed protein product [Caenorhabditis auriculariae]|uniref:EGF-like domain-containing protein n=1 Tax=Caenorhabditis auriculariae TaxID=2777116 RepID=A0A8S1HE71_9PELO|nr:unnamed protein product [Caenorhabditis auriculariae]